MMPRSFGSLRVDLVQVGQNGFDRCVQAVKIETVEAAFAIIRPLIVVMLPQPTDKIQDIRISPHPLRESLEPAKCFDAIDIVTCSANETVYTVRVWPIRFHRHGVKASLGDESLRNLCAGPVKFVGAM